MKRQSKAIFIETMTVCPVGPSGQMDTCASRRVKTVIRVKGEKGRSAIREGMFLFKGSELSGMKLIETVALTVLQGKQSEDYQASLCSSRKTELDMKRHFVEWLT